MLSALLLCFVIGIVVGLPILFVIISSSVIPGVVNPSFIGNIQYVLRSIVGGGDSTALLACPCFILSGVIMSKGGISKKIFNVFAYLIGKLPGGMPCCVVLTCLFYGAISGSGVATCAAVGSMTIPMLLELGYKPRFVGSLVASASGLAIIIPPSIPFILYGTATGTSIGSLFIAGVIPGIVMSICLMAYAVIYSKTKGENKERVEEVVNELHKQSFWSVIKEGFWALLTPVILLGGIYSGIVTPTEVACISVVYALIVSVFIYKTVKFNNIWDMLVDTSKQLAPLALMIAAAVAFGRVLTLLQLPQLLATFMNNTFHSKAAILLIINLALLLIGMFMDTGPALLIFAPMLLPLTQALGVDPIHLGIILTVNMAIGFISPPFGVTLFTASPMVKETPWDIGVTSLPFIAVDIIALLVITFIPWLSLALV